ncbi:MAG: pirin family protein, partial [Deltaproteobacteria bacterium]|nr:pirin family protein [Deltaproteobacteria bacterium]
MSATIETIIDGRSRMIDDLPVNRVLPAPTRRLVGPFIFLDHMGPATLPHGMDVRPHPHINLATVTYLFEGEIIHRDSLGYEQSIRPGAINWMTAGRGIVHSERSPKDRSQPLRTHGLQFWVALPTAHEQDDPEFHHYPAADIPEVGVEHARLRVLVGSAFGVTSPVKTVMRTLYVEAELAAGARLGVPVEAERAVYVVSGAITVDDEHATPGRMLVFKPGAAPVIRAEVASRVVVIGGDAIDGPRYMFWNFVSSDRDRLER